METVPAISRALARETVQEADKSAFEFHIHEVEDTTELNINSFRTA